TKYAFGGVALSDYASVTVNGDVYVTGDAGSGVNAGSDAKVTINGSITVVGNESIGAICMYGSEAIIEKTITAPNYVGFFRVGATGFTFDSFVILSITDNDAVSLLAGYDQYSYTEANSNPDYIWVRIKPVVPDPPTPTPSPGTGDVAYLAVIATLLASVIGTTCLVVYRRQRRQFS
ncbi:MAG: hypothetical protein LBU61_03125, partial [Coriobacteriales bacterium]|nr:hypothetical protein [Coriobacteriales bacterium]